MRFGPTRLCRRSSPQAPRQLFRQLGAESLRSSYTRRARAPARSAESEWRRQSSRESEVRASAAPVSAERRKSLAKLRSWGLLSRVQHHHAALRPQALQPVLQQVTDLLLQDHFADLARYRLQLWRRHMLVLVLRHQRLLVVALNLIRLDVDAQLEAILDEGEHRHALSPASDKGCFGETVIGEKPVPPRLGLTLILAACGDVLAQLINLFIHLRIRRRFLWLKLQLLKNQGAVDEPLYGTCGGELRLDMVRIECLQTHLFIHVTVEDQIVVHDCHHSIKLSARDSRRCQNRRSRCCGRRGNLRLAPRRRYWRLGIGRGWVRRLCCTTQG